MDVPLTSFVRALYPTYSHHLEFLQASAQLKDINFDTLINNCAGWEIFFGKRKKFFESPKEVVCLAQKEKN